MLTNRGQLDALIKELDSLGYDIDDDELTLDTVRGQAGHDYIHVTPCDDGDSQPFYVHWDGSISH